MRKAVKKILAVTVALVVAIGLAEVAIRLFYSPGDFLTVTLVPDPVLSHRIPPNSAGHDENGYRNRFVPDRPSIIAVGDSQTYGTSAGDRESWPAQLQGTSNRTVYNMGVGGYGPVDYAHVAAEGLEKFSPDLVVVGFYFGNDLIDCYNDVYSGDAHAELRDPRRVTVASGAREAEATQEGLSLGVRNWLSRHSMLYGLVKNRLSNAVFFLRAQAQAEEVGPDRLMVWEDPDRAAIRTAFTAQLRLSALAVEDDRVAEGVRITGEVMGRLRRELDARGVAMLVVLIPTKESVYEPLVASGGGRIPEKLRSLWEAERQRRDAIEEVLSTQGIAWVDALPAMQVALREGRQLYPQDGDGHPIGAGYGVIAEVVAGHAVVDRLNARNEDAGGEVDS